jgi:hypothetical protein
MFKITNAPSGTYEFKVPDIVGPYRTPNNVICDHNGTDVKIININYDNYNRPINLEPGLADLRISVKYSDNNGFSFKEPTLELLNLIKFIEYDYTNNESKILALMQGSTSVKLNSCNSPITVTDFHNIFTNIASGYYYILKIDTIDGFGVYKNSNQIVYQNVSKNQSYELEIKIIKDTTTINNIRFKIPIGIETIDYVDPFELNLVSGDNEESIEWTSIYPLTITFDGQPSIINDRKCFLSNSYSINNIFNGNDLTWVKPKNKRIIYSNDDQLLTINILDNIQDCTTNIETRVISNVETIIKQLDVNIINESDID